MSDIMLAVNTLWLLVICYFDVEQISILPGCFACTTELLGTTTWYNYLVQLMDYGKHTPLDHYIVYPRLAVFTLQKDFAQGKQTKRLRFVVCLLVFFHRLSSMKTNMEGFAMSYESNIYLYFHFVKIRFVGSGMFFHPV